MDKITYRVILVTRNYYNKTKFKKDVLYLYKPGQIRGPNINNFDNHGARCAEFIHESSCTYICRLLLLIYVAYDYLSIDGRVPVGTIGGAAMHPN